MGIIRVSDMLDLKVPGTGRSLDSTANKDLASHGSFEVGFQDPGVLSDRMDPSLALIN